MQQHDDFPAPQPKVMAPFVASLRRLAREARVEDAIEKVVDREMDDWIIEEARRGDALYGHWIRRQCAIDRHIDFPAVLESARPILDWDDPRQDEAA